MRERSSEKVIEDIDTEETDKDHVYKEERSLRHRNGLSNNYRKTEKVIAVRETWKNEQEKVNQDTMVMKVRVKGRLGWGQVCEVASKTLSEWRGVNF